MSNDGPLSFLRSWEGFLPPNTVLMAKRGEAIGDVKDSRSESAAELGAVELVFAFEAPDLGDPAAKEMLDKILAALELAPGEFAVFDRAPAELAAAVVVRFTADAKDADAGRWRESCLTTYSLRAMLGNPALKKSVWTQLKDALARGRRG